MVCHFFVPLFRLSDWEPNCANHDLAFLVVVVEHLTMQTLDAFVGVDVPLGMDRQHRTFVAAALAGVAALTVASQPVERRNRAGIAIAAPSGHT